MSFFEKRKKRKLYQQWVDRSGLPPESIPRELETEDAEDGEGLRTEEEYYEPAPRGRSTFVIHLTMRHLQILLLIIACLLIFSSVMTTILIMRSC
jgi:hypothetical protein